MKNSTLEKEIISYEKDIYGVKCIQEELLTLTKNFHVFCEKKVTEYSLCGCSFLDGVCYYVRKSGRKPNIVV